MRITAFPAGAGCIGPTSIMSVFVFTSCRSLAAYSAQTLIFGHYRPNHQIVAFLEFAFEYRRDFRIGMIGDSEGNFDGLHGFVRMQLPYHGGFCSWRTWQVLCPGIRLHPTGYRGSFIGCLSAFATFDPILFVNCEDLLGCHGW